MPTAWLRECVGVVIDLLGAGKDLADAIRHAGAVDGPASSARVIRRTWRRWGLTRLPLASTLALAPRHRSRLPLLVGLLAWG